MKSSLSARIACRLGLFSALLAATLAPSVSPAAETKKPTADAATAATAAKPIPMLSVQEFRKQQDWRAAIATTPKPKKGCFTAQYPSTEWKEVPCVDGPDYPMPPRSGIVPQTVGNGNDVAAQAPSGFISTAVGSFDALTNVTSESGQIAASGPSIANAYTLQINTDFFKTSVCAASPSSACRGWEQFVFENNNVSHRAFIQYWLIDFNTTCPATWQQVNSGSDIFCVTLSNSSGAVSTPAVPVTNLGQVTLTGTASAASDGITMTIGGTAFSRVGDNKVNASAGWSIAEFNVLGDGGSAVGVGSQAGFNAGAALQTRTRIIYGGNAPPNCVAQGFTAETNNLSFGPTAPAPSAPGPALLFNESIVGGSPANCAATTAVGDTHLTTLSGLLYDFQASGDFELLQTGSGFLVQNRQVSGAPTWPDAAVNSAVAARTGRTQVAICVKPRAVYIDRKPVTLTDGKPMVLADGTQISQNGNSYLVRGANGDWLRAGLNLGSGTNYIDVKVGLGQWPMEATGLLANPKEDPTLIAARDGKVFKTPFAFEDLYHPYADSWRVNGADSMVNVCGETRAGIPAKPFFARDLGAAVARRANAACTKAGVKEGPLLDACVLDVAVIGRASAAKIHANIPLPIEVGNLKRIVKK